MRKISGADAALLIGLFVCCVLAPLSCGARDQMRTVEADECVEVCDGSVR